jgi:hypothetical protein
VREIDQLNWLLASQLLDLERVTVNTADKDVKALKGTDGVNCAQLWAKGTNGELWADWAACLTLTSDVLTLSMSAKYWAPLDPKSLPPTLKTMSIWR